MTDKFKAECIYSKLWARRNGPESSSGGSNSVIPQSGSSDAPVRSKSTALSAQDDAKLIFGTVFSLRNMVRKLGGPDDKYVVDTSSNGYISLTNLFS